MTIIALNMCENIVGVLLIISVFCQTRATPLASDLELDVNQPVDESPRMTQEEKQAFWFDDAIERLERQLDNRENYNRAKNVIIFLGDGMSMTTVTAARIYKGQMMGALGEESHLEFEKLPYTGLSKTYCVNTQVADSACSATALLCGVKCQKGTLGVTGKVVRENCTEVTSTTSVHSLMYYAQEVGKSTGIVTTTRVTHASPAATYSHIPERHWEAYTKKNCTCKDIADQLITEEPGKNFNVIMGGGKKYFYPKKVTDEEGINGKRKDDQDLLKLWHKSKEGKKAQLITNRKQLLELDNSTDYLLGLFGPTHLDYHLHSDKDKQPTLAEMTEGAIKILSKNPKGYFLFVEGGRIDHGHHATKAVIALDETIEFSKAVGKALSMVNTEDTLVIVTADHAHTLTMSGYPPRGTPITGEAGIGLNSKPYSTLSYANGPHSKHSKGKYENIDTKFPSRVSLRRETHGGDDVPVYSIGPWAHLFKGSFEQNYVMLAVLYASCVGPLPTSCHPPRFPRTTNHTTS